MKKRIVKTILFYFYPYLYFFLFAIKNPIEKNSVTTSARTTASHIPSIPKINGNINIKAIWNNNVLKNEIAVEIGPLCNAVKKDELNMFNPLII